MLGDNWKFAKVVQSNTESTEEHNEQHFVFFFSINLGFDLQC